MWSKVILYTSFCCTLALASEVRAGDIEEALSFVSARSDLGLANQYQQIKKDDQASLMGLLEARDIEEGKKLEEYDCLLALLSHGDDPEAVIYAVELAQRYRMHFHKDVVIDIICYRRLGHNEADEPAITQPSMYRVIRALSTTRERYAEKLIAEGALTPAESESQEADYRNALDDGRVVYPPAYDADKSRFLVDWTPYLGAKWTDPAETAIGRERIMRLNERLVTLPEGFEPHRRVKRLLEDRTRMAQGEIAMDWGFAETMAYATLLDQGVSVRLSGEDAERGTFFHRHAVLHDQVTGKELMPLQTCSSLESSVQIHNSLLSETNLKFNLAVLPNRIFILSGSFNPGNSTKILFSPLWSIVGSFVPTSSILLLTISIDCCKAALLILRRPNFEKNISMLLSLFSLRSNSNDL